MRKTIVGQGVFGPVILLIFVLGSFAQTVQPPFPVKRVESPETWRRDGWNAIEQAKKTKIRKGKAKNVILFIGDGMGVSTLTASRIFEGQMRGESGEENRLSFEEFPFSALSKTYSANQQTSDSAPTMSAIITGVKTDEGTLSVDQNVRLEDYKTVAGNESKTLLEYAEDAGKSTGIISTARLTHATPAACYAHTAGGDWESHADLFLRKKDAYQAKFPDIARQMFEFNHGYGMADAPGGGQPGVRDGRQHPRRDPPAGTAGTRAAGGGAQGADDGAQQRRQAGHAQDPLRKAGADANGRAGPALNGTP